MLLRSAATPDATVPGPGPVALPAFLVRWLRHGEPAVDDLFDRYGDTVSLHLPGIRPGIRKLVLVRDPSVMKPLLTASPEDIDATEGNRVLEPLYGPQSLFLLDGPRHRRLRKLMLPPLRGEALEAWREAIDEVASRTARELPTDTPVALHPRLLRASLEVMLRIALDIGRDRFDEWAPDMEMLLKIAASEQFSARYLVRHLGALDRWPLFRRTLDRCDRQVREEIARRRRDPQPHHDLLQLLLDAEGEPLGDDEIRDQVFTLLIAGHETTATTISWAVERLLRHPEARDRLVTEARTGTDDAFARAVVSETLRIRPPVFVFARVTRTAYQLGAHTVPPNTLVVPYVRSLHEHEELYDDGRAFRPERFLEAPPGSYTFLAFGGGAHRCLGDRLAVFESSLFLHALFRELDIEPHPAAAEGVRRKAVTYIPGRRTRVRVRPASCRSGPA